MAEHIILDGVHFRRVNSPAAVDGSVDVGGLRIETGRIEKDGLPVGGVRLSLLTGAVAGSHAMSDVTASDELVGVLYFPGAGVAVVNVLDLSAEFAISGAGTIDNTGGTNTTGGKLAVLWLDRS